jgi:hypothetical protein
MNQPGAVFFRREGREIDMRPTIVSLVLGCFALLGGVPAGFAQSAYDYPWCALYTKTSGATSCYFTSFEQCIATMRGIGGTCIRNPYDGADHRGAPRSLRP